jgi:hypothetical protein
MARYSTPKHRKETGAKFENELKYGLTGIGSYSQITLSSGMGLCGSLGQSEVRSFL